jgi:hypothetical protein
MPPSRLMKIHPEPETQKCPEVRRAKKSIGASLILTTSKTSAMTALVQLATLRCDRPDIAKQATQTTMTVIQQRTLR